MRENRLFKPEEFDELVDHLNQSRDENEPCILLLDRPLPPENVHKLSKHKRVICLATGSGDWGKPPLPNYVLGYVNDPNDPTQLLWALETASKSVRERHQIEHVDNQFQQNSERLDDLLKASLELANERDIEKLCDKILTIMRRLVFAEGASLYLVSEKSGKLRFSNAQNENIKMEVKEFSLPLSDTSMAGACAFRKEIIKVNDVDCLSTSNTFKFDPRVDDKSGYQTRSALCFPIIKRTGEVIGVIQLINSKRTSGFSDEDIGMGRALSTHIAVALETALLYEDIENVFEGFIKASVTAIEARDPSTSGHSERVATLTVGLADKVSDSQEPLFREINFNSQKIKELRYASLLHDFGKIGVPEPVLVKSKKLFPDQLREIENRIQVLKLAYPKDFEMFEKLWQSILQANEPKVLPEELKEDLSEYVGMAFNVLGNEVPLLTDQEWFCLSIKKGSLNPKDRAEIESHVTHTYRFLQQIPWTGGLARVPEIAHAHHEKLDGSGYPRRITAKDIPFESQIMTVTDIFDALTASDRPYKKAVPTDRALEILKMEADAGQINVDLVELFIQQRIYETINDILK